MSAAGSKARAIAVVIAGALALAWPAFYNGFPLVFWDSGNYLSAAILHVQPLDRPVYFSVFTVAVSRMLGLWMVPLVQAFLTVSVLAIAFRVWCPIARWRGFLAIVAALAAFSPLPWVTSWVMPDFLGGLLILAVACLTLAWRDLTSSRQVALAACVGFAAVSHTANLVLLGGLVLFCAGWMLWDRACMQRPVRLLAGVFAASCVAVIVPNRIAHGEWAINMGREAMLTARFIDFGVFQPALARRCQQSPAFALCPYQDRLRGLDGQAFLHRLPSLAQESGAWTDHRAEYAEILRVAWQAAPGTIVSGALRDSVRLSARVTLGGDKRADSWYSQMDTGVRTVVVEHYPHEISAFDGARQQRRTLARPLVEHAQLAGAVVGLIGTTLAIAGWWRVRNRRALAMTGLVALGLLGNAVIHAAFSGVFDRYQARVMWLPLFLAAVGFLSRGSGPIGSQPGTPAPTAAACP
ncbi:MAG: hypothetical protein IT480_00715 [Gammaproteobacteria bacterium]|nr:hypothetical protein [Gammaproteobacteria bacterium]